MKKISLKDRQGQREIIARLDAASSYLDALPKDIEGYLNLDEAYFKSALGFLFGLIKKMGVSEGTLKEWIIDILTVVLPTIEGSVKASLLANIKKVVDCRLDPRIPEYIRKPYSDGYFTPKDLSGVLSEGKVSERGLIINIDAIDPNAMLSVSPFVGEGKELYFGQFKSVDGGISLPQSYTIENENTDSITKVKPVNPYQFTRAEDFNAFLWFCVHKGKMPSPSILEITGSTLNIGGVDYNVIKGDSVVDYIQLSGSTEGNWSIKEGSTFTSKLNKSMLSCFINRDGAYADIVPVSSDWNSCNWYVDKSRYYNQNLTATATRTPREYGKEMGICNIKYMKPYDYASRTDDERIQGTQNLLFTILPKPYVLTPSLAVKDDYSGFDFKFALKKILFSPNSEPDPNGKYTVNPSLLDWKNATTTDISGKKVLKVKLTVGDDNYFYYIDRSTYGFMNGDGTIMTGTTCDSFIVECYNGLTVYEFNYDFVMGMRLFDPGVITRKMLNNILNPNYYTNLRAAFGSRGSNSFNASMASSKLKMMLAVKKMIEEDEEFSDCLFHFSNEDYDELLKIAADEYYNEIPYKRWNMPGATVDTTTIDRILDGFPSEGSPDVQRKTIEKAIVEAEAIIEQLSNSNSDTMVSSDSRAVKVDFCQEMLYSLTAILVDAIISPKLLLLMDVNRQIMGEGDNTNVDMSFQKLMDATKEIVNGVVNEIKEAIIQKLLDYVLSYIKNITMQLYNEYVREQYEVYLIILRKLISLFKKGISTMGSIGDMLSEKFGEYGSKYSEENYSDFNIDIPTALFNTSYFEYIEPSKIEEPEDLNC